MTLPDAPAWFGDELSLELQVLNAEDDWDVILRNEDEVADSMLHTKSPCYSADLAEEELFPNLTFSKVLRPSSMIRSSSRDDLPAKPSELPTLIAEETSQPMVVDEDVPVESDLDLEVDIPAFEDALGEAEEQQQLQQAPADLLCQKARLEEIQLLHNMGFDGVEALLHAHVNPSLQRVDTDAVQRIIGMLLSQLADD